MATNVTNNLITINVDKTRAQIGQIIAVSVVGSGTFPEFKKTILYIGGVPARITNHNNKLLYAIIPVGVDSGDQNVTVFDRDNGTISSNASINVFYENVVFDEDTTKKYSTRFASTPLKTYSIYSRDLAYTNYTEITDASSVIQNVLSIILTRKGERFFNPNIGTRIMDMLFSLVPNPELLEKELMLEIKLQVETYEIRAKIHADKSFVDFDADHNALYVVVYVEVPGGSTKELGITLSTVGKN